MTSVAYVGLGSNVGDRLAYLRSAVATLHDPPAVRVVRCSPVYETDPVGPAQPDFLNAVAEVRTRLSAHDFLDRLKAVERRVGRTPAQRWGPREVDLDLLLFGDATVDDGRLRVPHPEMTRRAFVLVPLDDLAPDVEVPGAGRVRDVLAVTGRAGVRLLYPPEAICPS